MPTPFDDLRRQLIPDDDTGQVLRQMLDDGDDLSRPRDVEFYLVFAGQRDAVAFAQDAAALEGFQVLPPEQDEEGIWQVTAIRHMAPEHAAITAYEHELAELATRHRGYPDGWGCMHIDPEAG